MILGALQATVARHIPTLMVGGSLAIQENFNILIKVFQ
jgi:hypothetical protein